MIFVLADAKLVNLSIRLVEVVFISVSMTPLRAIEGYSLAFNSSLFGKAISD